MHRVLRLLGIVVLVAALFGLGVYAEASVDSRWPYPPNELLAENYDQYVGQETLLFGTVEEIREETALIEVDHDSGSVLMEVQNFEGTVQPGGTVQVYGTLGSDYAIDADRVVVVNSSARSGLFKIAISALAVGLYLVVFVRDWSLNLDTLELEGRADG